MRPLEDDNGFMHNGHRADECPRRHDISMFGDKRGTRFLHGDCKEGEGRTFPVHLGGPDGPVIGHGTHQGDGVLRMEITDPDVAGKLKPDIDGFSIGVSKPVGSRPWAASVSLNYHDDQVHPWSD